MAFEQGVPTSQEDLMDKFQTFASANGWTINNFSTIDDKLSISRGNIFAHYGWDNTTHIAQHQSLGFISAGTALDAHTNDSGQGGLSTSDRAINDIGNGPFISYWFFTNTVPQNYIWAVLEYAPGQFRHFGMCDIEKRGDWTGGEIVCCTTWSQVSGSDAKHGNHCVMTDGACISNVLASTMHIEGMPAQAASSKWGLFAKLIVASLGLDGDGNSRASLIGGMRGGHNTIALGGKPSSLLQGFIPLLRVPVFYADLAPAIDRGYFLGYVPGLRNINMAAFQPGDEFTQGSDTWLIFPMIRRQPVGGSGEQSGFGGIAYLKTV